eukprot:365334-Chlamydomonas_euryale.AAC.26
MRAAARSWACMLPRASLKCAPGRMGIRVIASTPQARARRRPTAPSAQLARRPSRETPVRSASVGVRTVWVIRAERVVWAKCVVWAERAKGAE